MAASQGAPSVHYFDVVDLNEYEANQLAEVAETATYASDLDAVADILARLRLGRRVIGTAVFEPLVARGEISEIA